LAASGSATGLASLVHRDPNVYLVPVPIAGAPIIENGTNCYVIKDGDDALIVDVGAPTDESARFMLKALDELGVSPSKASYFITHFHYDHAGLLMTVATPETRVYCSEAALRLASRFMSDYNAATQLERFAQEGFPDSEFSKYKSMRGDLFFYEPRQHDFVFVDEETTIRVGDYVFCPLDTTGHTTGHLALYHEDSGILFGGDHILETVSPSIDMILGSSNCLQLYVDNLRKVLNLNLSRLFVGHGREIPACNQRVQWLLDHIQNRIVDILDLIVVERGIRGDRLIKAIQWNVPYNSWEQITPIQRWCIVVEGIVYLDHLCRRGQIYRKCIDGVNRYFVS
jgi:glyoxylase-like metal-dependent hydrolase (beta-lactamase superfamily II)